MDESMQVTPVDYVSAFKWIKGICAGVGGGQLVLPDS